MKNDGIKAEESNEKPDERQEEDVGRAKDRL